MNPEHWRQVEELYHSALERPAELRLDFLAQSCGGDPELQREIESLLAQSTGKSNSDPSNDDIILDRPAWENEPGLLEETHAPIKSGEQLGPYRVLAKIGEGGMGAVYRAHDSRLGRDVAIKIVSPRFTARFEREARAIAALNHPHTCVLFDVGPNYLVMELLEGETLAARLGKGRLSTTEATRLGAQIAGALAEAHAKGVTHCDLKPANVMLTRQGAKILDFGIAAFAGSGQSLTTTGVIMGTPSYMAPEQRRGEKAEARTDIYALGLILYEMCTGTRPDVQAGKPIEGIPAPLAPVIERCLAAEPSDRWQAVSDVKAILEWSGTQPSAGASARQPKRTWLPMAVFGVGVAFAGATAWTVLRDRPAPPALNASLLPPPETSFRFARNGEGGFALSPDGTMLAFVGRTEGKAQLWARSLGESESRLLPGSEGAYNPFWSPDSRWIAFFTPQKLKKIEIANGAAIDLCDMEANNKGSWGSRGVILLAGVGLRANPTILRISDAGGSPMPAPGAAGRDPRFLPDGRRFVYARGGVSQELWLASLDPDEKPRRVGEAGEQPTYSAGHILSVVNGILVARPFDLARGEFRGESFPLKAPLARRPLLGYLFTDFSANAQGMLVYPPQTNSVTELRWRDRTGKLLGSLGAPGENDTPRISPDGRRVAFSRRDGNNSDIWVANPDANSFTRLTFDRAINENPVWSADGATVTFGNNASGNANLYRKAASGAGTIDRLTTNTIEEQPLDWSRDGRFLLYTQLTRSTEIMIQAASGGQPLSFLGHARGASKAQFNPGVPRWIAYDFDDSGRREIYVQAFEPGNPASSARWQISNGGGMMPRWRGDGKEILYLSLDGKMMGVRVSSDGAAFQSSTPQFLFNATPPNLRTPNFEYDVSADGERFLMIEPMVKPEYQPLTLVSNWRSR